MEEKLPIRLKKVLDAMNFEANKSKVARLFGMKSQTLSKMYQDNKYPDGENLEKIAIVISRELKINLQWLLTGEGDMVQKKATAEISQTHNGIGDNNIALENCQGRLREKEELILALKSQLADKQAIIELQKNKS